MADKLIENFEDVKKLLKAHNVRVFKAEASEDEDGKPCYRVVVSVKSDAGLTHTFMVHCAEANGAIDLVNFAAMLRIYVDEFNIDETAIEKFQGLPRGERHNLVWYIVECKGCIARLGDAIIDLSNSLVLTQRTKRKGRKRKSTKREAVEVA